MCKYWKTCLCFFCSGFHVYRKSIKSQIEVEKKIKDTCEIVDGGAVSKW